MIWCNYIASWKLLKNFLLSISELGAFNYVATLTFRWFDIIATRTHLKRIVKNLNQNLFQVTFKQYIICLILFFYRFS